MIFTHYLHNNYTYTKHIGVERSVVYKKCKYYFSFCWDALGYMVLYNGVFRVDRLKNNN
jgi:hypothetical protein